MADFLDSNVLVYAWDPSDTQKQVAAARLVRELANSAVISSQVLQEFASVMLRKFGHSADQVDACLDTFKSMRLLMIDFDLVRMAVATADAHTMSFWDALIVEAAVAGGCKTLWTEDLTHGQVIRGVKIKSPFK